jgi:ABC-type nitrate/sulfonate/bicarbonate transport system substrate-binding protein
MPSRPILLALALAFAMPAFAADPVMLSVNTFPTARSLPFYVAVDKGVFLKHGLKVDLDFTQNSKNLRDGLASGKYHIVHAAVDNGVAMVEMGRHDVVIVTGGDSGTNEFIVQRDINSFADIRGRPVVVDAPNTAYALQAKKILLKHGLKDGVDYSLNPAGNGNLRYKAMTGDAKNAAAVMNLPYSLQAQAAGLKSLGRTIDMIGPYQAGGAFTMRAWAKANGETVERYIAAFVEALRWSLNAKNRDESIAMLVARLKLTPEIATRSYDLMIDPAFGFAPDARFNHEGFRNVLALRAEVEGGTPAAPERYVDLSYYARALKRID